MATTIKSTDLDFDDIKTRLKDYLRSKTEFADYDFEAAGLSNILDVLAYNTHFNGLTANFALNESFLNTSQLRSSIVSHAEMLGYVPLSVTSSVAYLNLSLTISTISRPVTITIPRGTTFTSTASGVSYTFRTLESYTATDNGAGFYQFLTSTGDTSIPVYEGVEKTKTFFVGEKEENHVYVIPDVTMNSASLYVRAFETSSSESFETYTNINTAVRIVPTSKHYRIKEVPNGYYELIFSDGQTTGKAPTAGNKIVVTYLSAVGEAANGGTTFTPTSEITIDSIDYPLLVTTETASAAGSGKESIESIRKNAPLLYATQQRMVTAEDYKAQILAAYNYIVDDVVAWGGADNDPPQYGKVYVGIKFKDGTSDVLQETIKDSIKTNLTDNLAVMSIDTVYVDAITSFLEVQTIFNFDPDLTTSTPRATENVVFAAVQKYFTDNLNLFDKVWRRSSLLTIIDALDESILNTKINVKVQQRFTPIPGSKLSYKIKFPSAIAQPDDENVIITTSRFTFNSRTCFIRNKLSSLKLEMINIDGGVEVDNIGTYIPETGVVDITGFNPSSVEGSSFIKVSMTPANQSTIRPLRNYVLDIDTDLSFALAQIDYQNTQISL